MCVVELVDHYTKIQRSTVIFEDKIQIDKYSGDLKAIPHRYQINLRGTKTNCGEVFRDPDTGIESKFFVFNDLAVFVNSEMNPLLWKTINTREGLGMIVDRMETNNFF